MRFVLKIAYIIEGRSLVQKFRINCPRCRFLNKKSVDVAMGPVSDHNLCIAPAFYISQVDIFGQFPAYSYVNKNLVCYILLLHHWRSGHKSNGGLLNKFIRVGLYQIFVQGGLP